MKKMLRMSVLSVLVLTALALSAFSAMALAPASGILTPTASATATTGTKQEVIGIVTAVDSTSITINGTVYPLSTTTRIEGAVLAGDTVKLEVVTNPDGSITVYEVAKPDQSSGTDVAGTEPASFDPTGTVEPVQTETIDLNKSSVVDPTSTPEPTHTETVSPDKGSSSNAHQDGKNAGSTPDKGGSSLEINSSAGKVSGHDIVSDPSQP